MAGVRLDVESFNAIHWHDAAIGRVCADLADNGVVSLVFRCILHPDEARDVLLGLGVSTQAVNIRFQDAWDIVFNLPANSTQPDTIDNCWCEILSAGASIRCFVTGSAGLSLTMTMAADAIWAEEVADG